MTSTAWVELAIAVGVIGAIVVLIDVYVLWRRRWRRFELFPAPGRLRKATIAGTNEKGELTTSAKYAIWNYMFSLFAVGGAIIAVVSGIAGYMIKDLANEKAIQVALNSMHKPLADRLAQFADAQSALNVAAKNVATEQFVSKVAVAISEDDKFLRKIVDGDQSRKSLAELLMAKYPDKLRGAVGPMGQTGPAGPPGINGTSPSVAAVAEAFKNDATFRKRVAELLANDHLDKVRGPAGPMGQTGPVGPPGASGTSPSIAAVAETFSNDGIHRTRIVELLMDKHADKLRGPAGPAGPIGPAGANGTSPSPAAVAESFARDNSSQVKLAELLAARHADKVRGPAGPAGQTGPAGPAGSNGTSPSVAAVAETFNNDGTFRARVAELLAAQHADKLRGPAGPVGPAGPRGGDGPSPNVTSVVEALSNDSAFRMKIAELLVAQFADRLRGPGGPPGPPGPPVANGASPSVASVAEALSNDGAFRTRVAELLVAQHADKIRGKDGRDGATAEEVASVLLTKHAVQFRQFLVPKPAPRPKPPRRRQGR
jgi:hypothetical protein